MDRSQVLLVLLSILLLLGCGTSDVGDEEVKKGPPEITGVWWIIDDRSNEPFSEPCGTASTTYFLYIDDPDRHSEITRIVLNDPEGGCWSWESDELAGKWDQIDRRFEMWNCCSPRHRNSILLGEYAIDVWREDGDPQNLTFDVMGRRDPTLTAGYIYSDACASTPKILKPPYDCSCSMDGDTLVVGFEADDEIADGGFVWCYTGSGSFLGITAHFEDVGTVNKHGLNTFRLDTSHLARAPAGAVIVLTASTPEDQGLYRAWSDTVGTDGGSLCESH
jgi:hypothetical protein